MSLKINKNKKLIVVPAGQTRQLGQKSFHVTLELVDDIKVRLLEPPKWTIRKQGVDGRTRRVRTL